VNVLSGTFDSAELWRETVKVFGADTLIMIDRTTSDVGHRYKFMDDSMTFHKCTNINEALNLYPNAEVILIETTTQCPLTNPSDAINLKDLTHPTGDAIYVFGPDSHGITGAERGKWVYFDIDHDRKGSSWSFVAAGIALYDRMMRKV